MITVNAMGDACPIPVIKTMNAIKELKEKDTIEVLVDNEIAVQNLTKMAAGKGFRVLSEKLGEKEYRVEIAVETTETFAKGEAAPHTAQPEAAVTCIPDARSKDVVVVISSSCMGNGDDELGTALMKGFLYAISQQEQLPSTILFYNGGARLTCEGAPTLEDLKSMEARGVEILTCGTCLDFYGLTDTLAVGSVTNMYAIAEKMTQAGLIIKP
ncbi:MAG: sulfurtransferase-like selenium metabolism protein YedF [Blautia sp.]|jgi:selenium metabolism protein YedF